MKRKINILRFTLFFFLFSFFQNLIAQDLSEVPRLISASDAALYDNFGQSVSISGDYAIVGVGAKEEGELGFVGAAYIYHKDASGNWSEVKKVSKPTAVEWGEFGRSVSISGDYAIVGVSEPGEVYIYHKDTGGTNNWGLVKQISNPNNTFGHSVSMSGDYAVVSDYASSDNQGIWGAGTAYIYHKDEGGIGNWGQVKQIFASDPEQDAYFGGSVFISEDYIAVGSQGKDLGTVPNAGGVYIYHKDAGGIDNWGEIKQLTPPVPIDYNGFGAELSMYDGHLVIGDPGASVGSMNYTGAAYIYQKDEGGIDNWGQTKQVSASNLQAYANFGSSVSISKGYLIVGAPSAGAAGTVYLYRENVGGTSNWGEQQKITPSDSQPNDNFGGSVFISEDYTVIAAASGKNVGDDESAGAAYIYECTGSITSDKRGGMLDFDGMDDYVNVAAAGSLPQGASSRTIEAWIKTTQTSIGNIVSWGRKSAGMRSSLVVSGGFLGFVVEGQNLMGNAPINDGQWHHVAVTYEFGVTNLYIDGKLDASTMMGALNTTDQNLILGRESMPGTSEYYTGSVDEIRIWDIALSLSDIRRHMHSIPDRSCGDGLVAYYQFNGDDTTIPNGIKDNSRNHNDGTANNMAADNLSDSEVAVGRGNSSIRNITGTGLVSFVDEGVDIDFGTSPNGDVVVTRITTESPAGAENLTNPHNQYFVIRNYGTNTSPDVNGITFHNIFEIPATTVNTDIELYKRAGNSYGSWGVEIATANTITNHPNASVAFTGAPLFSGFSQFVLDNGGNNASLPVEVEDFYGKNDGSANHLYWVTASEENNKGFKVERSFNGIDFKQIGFVEGSGSTAEEKSYDFTDESPQKGINYYRLRQIDHDDSYEYSEVISIRTLVGNSSLVFGELYPNPSKAQIVQINYFAKESTEISLKVFDISGKLEQSRNVNISSGQHQFEMDFMDYDKGIYFIEFLNGDMADRRKLIIRE